MAGCSPSCNRFTAFGIDAFVPQAGKLMQIAQIL
jgi:hypothetical protein